MKVNLIYLPHPYLVEPDAQAPIGLLYLASCLEKQGKHKVVLSNLSAFHEKEALNFLEDSDVFGISVTCLELLQANDFAKKIKNKFPKAKILLGGAGTVSDEYIDFDIVDSILKGDGEITFLEMLDDIENNKLQKTYYGKRVDNLDDIPFPSRHLLGKNQGKHIFANRTTYDKTFSLEYKGKGSTVILTSRGCSFNCCYCAAKKLNPTMRFRSPENVYEEIKYTLDTFKIKQYRFGDEFFTANKKHALRICELIKPLGIVFRVSARVKPLSLEVLKAMKGAGCVEISFGVESFDDEVLKMLNKKTTSQDNANALHMAKEVGLMARILMMIRTPGQTVDTVYKNINCLKKVPYDTIAVTSLVPLPGTPLWDNPDKFNIEILNRNLNDYNFYFYGSDGKNELKDIIKIKDRTLEEFNAESEYFRNWVEKRGKINRG